MRYPTKIEEALEQYDREKGIWRKIGGDAPCIRALRELPPDHRGNLFRIHECFMRHFPPFPELPPPSASTLVYNAVCEMFYSGSKTDLDLNLSRCLLHQLHTLTLKNEDGTTISALTEKAFYLLQRAFWLHSLGAKPQPCMDTCPLEPVEVIFGLSCLKSYNRLTAASLRPLLRGDFQFLHIVLLLEILDSNELFDFEFVDYRSAPRSNNLDAVLKHRDARLLRWGLAAFTASSPSRPITQPVFDALITAARPEIIGEILCSIFDRKLQPPEDGRELFHLKLESKLVEVVGGHPDPVKLKELVTSLISSSSLFLSAEEWTQFIQLHDEGSCNSNGLQAWKILVSASGRACRPLLTKDTFCICIKHSDPVAVANLLVLLSDAQLLNGDRWLGQDWNSYFVCHPQNQGKLELLTFIFRQLGAGLRTQANFNFMLKLARADSLLIQLKEFLTELLASQCMAELQLPFYFEIACLLIETGLTRYWGEFSIKGALVPTIYRAMSILREGGMLTEQWLDIIKKHISPDKMAQALNILREGVQEGGRQEGMLTEQCLNVIEEHICPDEMAETLVALRKAGLISGVAALDEENLVKAKCCIPGPFLALIRSQNESSEIKLSQPILNAFAADSAFTDRGIRGLSKSKRAEQVNVNVFCGIITELSSQRAVLDRARQSGSASIVLEATEIMTRLTYELVGLVRDGENQCLTQSLFDGRVRQLQDLLSEFSVTLAALAAGVPMVAEESASPRGGAAALSPSAPAGFFQCGVSGAAAPPPFVVGVDDPPQVDAMGRVGSSSPGLHRSASPR